jgi:hypothetical protein
MSNSNFELSKVFDVKGKVALVTGGGSGIGLMVIILATRSNPTQSSHTHRPLKLSLSMEPRSTLSAVPRRSSRLFSRPTERILLARSFPSLATSPRRVRSRSSSRRLRLRRVSSTFFSTVSQHLSPNKPRLTILRCRH